MKGRPAFRYRITRGRLESKIVYRGVGADFEKQKNIFSANNEQGSMKRGEKWFSEKLRTKFGFLSSCCKGEACLPRSHYQEKHILSSDKICLHANQGTIVP